jgi:hypothetical protein
MKAKFWAASVAAIAALAIEAAPTVAQQSGKVQVVRGTTVESYTAKPQGALPAVVRGKPAREVEAAAAAPTPWVMTSGGSRDTWFYNRDTGRLVNCWRQNGVYVYEYRIVCHGRNLTLY